MNQCKDIAVRNIVDFQNYQQIPFQVEDGYQLESQYASNDKKQIISKFCKNNLGNFNGETYTVQQNFCELLDIQQKKDEVIRCNAGDYLIDYYSEPCFKDQQINQNVKIYCKKTHKDDNAQSVKFDQQQHIQQQFIGEKKQFTETKESLNDAKLSFKLNQQNKFMNEIAQFGIVQSCNQDSNFVGVVGWKNQFEPVQLICENKQFVSDQNRQTFIKKIIQVEKMAQDIENSDSYSTFSQEKIKSVISIFNEFGFQVQAVNLQQNKYSISILHDVYVQQQEQYSVLHNYLVQAKINYIGALENRKPETKYYDIKNLQLKPYKRQTTTIAPIKIDNKFQSIDEYFDNQIKKNIEKMYLYDLQHETQDFQNDIIVKFENIPNANKNKYVIQQYKNSINGLNGTIQRLNDLYAITLNMEHINTYSKMLVNAVQFAVLIEEKIADNILNKKDANHDINVDERPEQQIPTDFNDMLYQNLLDIQNKNKLKKLPQNPRKKDDTFIEKMSKNLLYKIDKPFEYQKIVYYVFILLFGLILYLMVVFY